MSTKGQKRTPEQRARISAGIKRAWREGRLIGHPISDAAREKIGAKSRGRTASPQTRQKISISKRGKRANISPEVETRRRAKISVANKGRVVTEDQRRRISISLSGRKRGPHSEETKAKISAKHKGKVLSAEHRSKLSKAAIGRTPWNKGVPMTVAAKAHLSEINTGKTPSEETRQKLRKPRGPMSPAQCEARRAKYQTPEFRQKMSEAGRKSYRDPNRKKGGAKGIPKTPEHRAKLSAAGMGHRPYSGGRGKCGEYRGVMMRSSYERRFAAVLDRHGVRWQYEPVCFQLVGTTYWPDFYLPDADTYIEVKGFLRDARKLEMFRATYPNVTWRIVFLAELEAIEAAEGFSLSLCRTNWDVSKITRVGDAIMPQAMI